MQRVSPSLWRIFREEASAHLATLRTEYASLLAAPAPAPISAAFVRAAHTLAGSAASVGLAGVSELARALEHALLHARQQAAGEELMATLGSGIEQLAALLDAGSEGADAASERAAAELVATLAAHSASAQRQSLRDEIDAQLLPTFLEEAGELEQEIAAALRAWRSAPAAASALALTRRLHTLKGSARMAGALHIGELAHAIETRVEDLQQAGMPGSADIDAVESAIDGIGQRLDRLRATAAPAGQPPPTTLAPTAAGDEDGAAAPHTLRVRPGVVERLVNDAGELSIARTRIAGEVGAIRTTLRELGDSLRQLRQQLRACAELETAQLDGERQVFGTRLVQAVDAAAALQHAALRRTASIDALLATQARINRELQQELLGVRRTPFSRIAERLQRTVRQSARELGKQVELDLRGATLEIDSDVLERLAAPLEHLLRNAVAHGIEAPAVRAARGKPPCGQITLQLTQAGKELLLTLADDGGGLDGERIRAQAVASGLLATGDAASADLLELVFQPGFSTAALSPIAGRGVGLDVVRTEIARLGGRIELVSRAGSGVSVHLRLPLSLALMQALLVRAGGATYAIPAAMIAQVRELPAAERAAIRKAGAVYWQGARYPLRTLGELLGTGERQAASTGTAGEAPGEAAPGKSRLLLLDGGAERIALALETLGHVQEIVVKKIGAQLDRLVGIDGATVLGDGQIALIVNPVAIASRRQRLQPAAAGQGEDTVAVEARTAMAAPPTLLVVDDSPTALAVTRSVLASAGYRVRVADNGFAALAQVREFVPDAIVVDGEMPGMDGRELVARLRADARLGKIPVLMLSARAAPEPGVARKLGKPFRADELLAAVAELLQRQSP